MTVRNTWPINRGVLETTHYLNFVVLNLHFLFNFSPISFLLHFIFLSFCFLSLTFPYIYLKFFQRSSFLCKMVKGTLVTFKGRMGRKKILGYTQNDNVVKLAITGFKKPHTFSAVDKIYHSQNIPPFNMHSIDQLGKR